mgnify:CR=1 FL=1|tara:strand:- start:166 stop:1137 length:972 start_codon:yes stop_codon:yes gene_type:complete
MKIICTTVVRAAEQGGVHGGLYVVDIDTEEVVHHAAYEEEFVNDNERGGERGLRGIIVLDDRIIVSDSAGFIQLDRNDYSIVKTVQNPEAFKSIHEICYHNGFIWATSTAYDAIVRVDLNFKVNGFWEIKGESRSDHKAFIGKEKIAPEDHSNDDNYHINSIYSYNGNLLFSGLITGLYDFEDVSPVIPMPYLSGNILQELGIASPGMNITKAASFIHNFHEYDDIFAANFTSFSCLGIATKQMGGIVFDVAPIPRAKKVKFCVDDIARNNWNRGLARHGNLLFVGSSPARILVYDLNKSEFIKEIQLEDDIRHAIHGLEVLE